MLKGISPILTPELLKTIAEMGHGDELAIGDANFPAASMNARCLRCDGHKATDVLDAILQLFPLDQFTAEPVTLMSPGDDSIPEPPIWKDFKAITEKNQPGTKCGAIDRFEFYDRARKAYACVSTGERQLYACVIIKKGVI